MMWVFWLTTLYSFVEGSCCTDLQEHFYPDGHGNRSLSSVGNHLTNQCCNSDNYSHKFPCHNKLKFILTFICSELQFDFFCQFSKHFFVSKYKTTKLKTKENRIRIFPLDNDILTFIKCTPSTAA